MDWEFKNELRWEISGELFSGYVSGSELLRFWDVQNFAKNDTENVKLAALRLRQSVFCINAKTCPSRICTKFFKETVPGNNPENPSLGFFFYPILHRTLQTLAVEPQKYACGGPHTTTLSSATAFCFNITNSPMRGLNRTIRLIIFVF